VMGGRKVKFLRKGYERVRSVRMFDRMEYTEGMERMRKWMGLMMRGGCGKEMMGGSKIEEGRDVK
ncbi:malate:quinone oxidoreductase, partial [Staphylococcus epidermidis]|uniref:malate:quinone oxidoreductase n=1 Tax=Staphylococcus epidermidis TaxID=1282 RepID=UPI00164261D4